MILPAMKTDPSVPTIGLDTQELLDDQTIHVKRLLELNHTKYSILYNNYRFHNHSPHFLGSAYLYGGSSEYLQSIYDDLVVRDNLESWRPSPGPITLDNYRAHLGKGEYQRGWVDFFKTQMHHETDRKKWQSVVTKFLFAAGPSGEANPAPMFQCLNTALGHPLIHLGYAYELNSPVLAAEALGLVATCYDEQFATLLTIEPSPAVARVEPTPDLMQLFERVHHDETLPTFPQPGDDNIDLVLEKREHVDAVLAYVNAWSITYPTLQLSQTYYFASLLLASTSPQVRDDGFDFFLVHMLTTAHAVRVLLPHLPGEYHTPLLKQWLLVAVLAYVAQKRPKLDVAYVKAVDLQGRDWEYVRQQAIGSKFSMDAHFVKACRALRVGYETWKDVDDEEWFLKCAVKFVSEFDGWGGFDVEAENAEVVKQSRRKDGIYVR